MNYLEQINKDACFDFGKSIAKQCETLLDVFNFLDDVYCASLCKSDLENLGSNWHVILTKNEYNQRHYFKFVPIYITDDLIQKTFLQVSQCNEDELQTNIFDAILHKICDLALIGANEKFKVSSEEFKWTALSRGKFADCKAEILQNYSDLLNHVKTQDYLFQDFLITQCLRKSEKILKLKEDWDNAGSEGFTIETWRCVVHFLTDYARQVYLRFNRCIDIPKIYPSANGSIDIDWETENFGFLINIAKDGKSATYYADNKKSQKIEGTFNPELFDIRLLPIAILVTND